MAGVRFFIFVSKRVGELIYKMLDNFYTKV
nr:MAG TPA: hypothetical protein [Caudoviricetes sp.]